MKIRYLTIIAAMLASTPAFACDFVPGGSISNEMATEFVTNVRSQNVSTIGQAAPDLMRGVIGGKSAETMASLPEGCGTIEAFIGGFYSVNGFAAEDPITRLSDGFRLPAIKIAAPVPMSETETSKPVMVADESTTEYVPVEVDVAEIVPVQKAVTKSVAPPVREAVVTPQNVLDQISANKAAIAAYQAQPVADRSPETDAAIAELQGRLSNAEALLNQLPKNEQGQIDLAKLTPTQVVQTEQVVAEVQETSSLVESYIGRSMLDWIIITVAVIVGLGILVNLFHRFLKWGRGGVVREKDVVQIVDAKLAVVKLDDLFKARLTADVTALKAGVDNLSEQLDLPTILLENGWYEKVMGASVGDDIGLEIMFDDEPRFITNVKKGDGSNAYILSGIQGQQPGNSVKIGNLQKIVRGAWDQKDPAKRRLTNQIGGLKLAVNG